MSYKKTTFNSDWLDAAINPQWSKWLRCVDNDPYKAKCIACSKTFSLSNMGKQAITSHEHSEKHIKNVKGISNNRMCFFQKSSGREEIVAAVPGTSSSVTEELNVPAHTSVKPPSITNFLTKEDTLRAEIIWAMQLVMSHSSYNGFKDVSSIFKLMFPDSKIAKSVSMGSTKMSYIITFGLAPYFMQCLRKEISGCHRFVICFDEALNRISQRGQMDFVVRYWSPSSNKVCSRYLTSVFLGHCTAEDLVEKFYEGLEDLPLAKLLQISMDGPNVNLKFLRLIMEDSTEKGYSLFDLGTCGLHVVHGAFRTGHNCTKWHLNDVFKAMHRLFKDSPARRADFISVTGTTKFPLKFCQVRWIENILVAERAIEVYPKVKLYLQKTELTKTATTERVATACNDKLMLAKIAFFSSVAAILEPFLRAFQTDGPYAPYLYDATVDVILQLLKRFIKQELIESSKRTVKFLNISVVDSGNWMKLSNVDIGIAAGRYLTNSGATDAEKRSFRSDCRQFLIATVQKVIERSPLRYPIVRFIACLNPKLIASNAILCEARMEKLLQVLHEKKHISSISADKAKSQFSSLCYRANTNFKELFSSFTRETRLDSFFASICMEPEFKELWEVVKLVLIFSHGNAVVESGFSINKDILVENMHETSLIALRTVSDALKAAGGVSAVTITKDMQNHVRMSRQRYVDSLEGKKKAATEEQKRSSEKRKALDMIKALQKKKAKLSQEVVSETEKINLQIEELKQVK